MSRIARAVAINLPHHITQRGNYQQDIFIDDEDRLQYLEWIREYSERLELAIWAYCLMTNHVHFIVVPGKEDSIKTFNYTHMRYSQYFNKKIEKRGHLWQGRFYSCILDKNHALSAIKYIERNPVRAKMVENASDWKWSSAKAHITGKNKEISLEDISLLIKKENWGRYLEEPDEESTIEIIKCHTNTGRPLGEDNFIKKLEKQLDRRLKALPIGRPKKE